LRLVWTQTLHWTAVLLAMHLMFVADVGDEPQTDFQPYRSRGSVQLRRSGTNIALNGDFTFCALNDSNDLDVVKRPQSTTCTRVGYISFQSHLNGQILEESKGHSKERLSSRSSRPSRVSANPRYVPSVIRTHWAMRIGFSLIDLFAHYDLSRMFNYALHVMEML
jgi:hypothetical protein